MRKYIRTLETLSNIFHPQFSKNLFHPVKSPLLQGITQLLAGC